MDAGWGLERLHDIEHRFDVYVGETAVMGAMGELQPACDDYADDMEDLLSTLRRRIDGVWCW